MLLETSLSEQSENTRKTDQQTVPVELERVIDDFGHSNVDFVEELLLRDCWGEPDKIMVINEEYF